MLTQTLGGPELFFQKNVLLLEDTSERSQRCAKISSGFAPIMMFGGLVFICIGISASTNTGKDKEKLKNLSFGPLTVGVFMILLAMFLILMWLCCRSRARVIDHKLLHGSQRSSTETRQKFFRTLSVRLRRRFFRTEHLAEQRATRRWSPTEQRVIVCQLPTETNGHRDHIATLLNEANQGRTDGEG